MKMAGFPFGSLDQILHWVFVVILNKAGSRYTNWATNFASAEITIQRAFDSLKCFRHLTAGQVIAISTYKENSQMLMTSQRILIASPLSQSRCDVTMTYFDKTLISDVTLVAVLHCQMTSQTGSFIYFCQLSYLL